ncbi:MAG: ABC transporter ATP-binding protein [Thermoanaerobaculia bacterium]|jgi:putative ABC transport system ATP-binding protein
MPIDLSDRAPTIELSGVSKSYREADRDHIVLEGVDLLVQPGELVVLLGRSGSGKSTLLNLLGGLDQPDSGSVAVGGIEITSLGERDRTLFRRRNIGFIFQFFNLLPTLTVLENLLLPLELDGKSTEAVREPCLEMLAAVGLVDRADSFPDRLSGGERQRVAVARGLIHQPQLILADEPTGNLDVGTGRQVIDLLDSLTRQSGRTLLMATHSQQVVGLADRILTIENGRLVELDKEGPA